MAVQLIQHIDISPDICGGAPRIAGTRISVPQIVVMVEHLQTPVKELADQYTLTPGQIYAALSYYYDHQKEIDRLIAEDERLLEQARQQPASPQEARIRALWQKQQAAQAAIEMTVKEIAQTYNLDESTIREAAQRGWVKARKSGAVWLIRREDAEARWG